MAGNNLVELKTKLDAPSVKAKFESMLGKRAPQFIQASHQWCRTMLCFRKQR